MGAKQLREVFKKEFDMLSSDKRTLAIYLLGPILVMAAFGAATSARSSEILHINIALVDEDSSRLSADLGARFEQSEYVAVKYKTDRANAEHLLKEGEIDAYVVIEKGFDSKVKTFYLHPSESDKARLSVVVDSAVPTVPVTIPLALQSVLVEFYQKDLPRVLDLPGGEISPELVQQIATRLQVVAIGVDMKYGENLSFFTVTFPILTPIVLFTFGLMMCGLTIVGERIRGTLPRLLKTPTRRSEIVLGKLLAYLTIALWQNVVVLALSVMLFGLAVRGGVLQLFAAMFLTSFCGCTWGLLHSTFGKSDRQVTEMNTNTVIVLLILGGIVFPINTMPEVVQLLAQALPLSHSLTALRSIAIRGLGLEFVGFDLFYLAAFGTLLLILGLTSFRFAKE
jgi:ABC-2 type transport system permease protein